MPGSAAYQQSLALGSWEFVAASERGEYLLRRGEHCYTRDDPAVPEVVNLSPPPQITPTCAWRCTERTCIVLVLLLTVWQRAVAFNPHPTPNPSLAAPLAGGRQLLPSGAFSSLPSGAASSLQVGPPGGGGLTRRRRCPPPALPAFPSPWPPRLGAPRAPPGPRPTAPWLRASAGQRGRPPPPPRAPAPWLGKRAGGGGG
jgi:hypothetical protein